MHHIAVFMLTVHDLWHGASICIDGWVGSSLEFMSFGGTPENIMIKEEMVRKRVCVCVSSALQEVECICSHQRLLEERQRERAGGVEGSLVT